MSFHRTDFEQKMTTHSTWMSTGHSCGATWGQ